MTLYIEDETMIVGNQASSNKDAPIFPEYTLEFVLNEWIYLEKRRDVFYITERRAKDPRQEQLLLSGENNNLRAWNASSDEVQVYVETGFMEGKMNSGMLI